MLPLLLTGRRRAAATAAAAAASSSGRGRTLPSSASSAPTSAPVRCRSCPVARNPSKHRLLPSSSSRRFFPPPSSIGLIGASPPLAHSARPASLLPASLSMSSVPVSMSTSTAPHDERSSSHLRIRMNPLASAYLNPWGGGSDGGGGGDGGNDGDGDGGRRRRSHLLDPLSSLPFSPSSPAIAPPPILESSNDDELRAEALARLIGVLLRHSSSGFTTSDVDVGGSTGSASSARRRRGAGGARPASVSVAGPPSPRARTLKEADADESWQREAAVAVGRGIVALAAAASASSAVPVVTTSAENERVVVAMEEPDLDAASSASAAAAATDANSTRSASDADAADMARQVEEEGPAEGKGEWDAAAAAKEEEILRRRRRDEQRSSEAALLLEQLRRATDRTQPLMKTEPTMGAYRRLEEMQDRNWQRRQKERGNEGEEVGAAADDVDTNDESRIPPDVYAALIRRLPPHDMHHKFEVLRGYIRSVQRQQSDSGDDDGGEGEGKEGSGVTTNGGGSGSGSSGKVDVASYVEVCDSVPRWVSWQKRRGSGGSSSSRHRPRHRSRRSERQDIATIVTFLRSHLRHLPVDPYQHRCLPRLIAAALSSSSEPMWDAAASIYDEISGRDFPVDVATYRHILGMSTYRNAGHFPFWKVLKVLADDYCGGSGSGSGAGGGGGGGTTAVLHPSAAINVLRNGYPFTDRAATRSVLRSMLSLQAATVKKEGEEEEEEEEEGDDNDDDGGRGGGGARTTPPDGPGGDYRPDVGTLEQVVAGGARSSDPTTVLLAWDLAESTGIPPTLAMYEGAVAAFASSATKQDHNAFAALAEMEDVGHVPARSLIKSVARCIGYTPGRLDNAYYILTNGTEGTKITTASMNCIMAACAFRGDVQGAFATFDDFDRFGLDPDANTLSFLMESLAWEMSAPSDSDPPRSESEPESYVEAADEIMAISEERNLVVTHHLLHQYLRVIVEAGQLDKALLILEDAVERSDRVLMETFALVALRHANKGHFDKAWYVANEMYPKAGYGKMPDNILRRIKNIKKASTSPRQIIR